MNVTDYLPIKDDSCFRRKGEHSLPLLVGPFTNGTKAMKTECECDNWACNNIEDLINGNGHHPRCEKYEARADPRHAVFGKLMWEYIVKHGEEFCWNEWSEEVLPLARQAGLCGRVKYDPILHGDLEADPGSEIWWWGPPYGSNANRQGMAAGDELNNEGDTK